MMIPPETVSPSLRIVLFGPMQVLVQGKPLPRLRSRKALWLLALLTLRHGRPVEREWLSGVLWSDMDQSQAFANLRPILSDLRSALGSEGARLQSPNRHTLLLELADAQVDVIAFDEAIVSKNLTVLEQAVALYRGQLLEGCLEEWVPQERRIREESCLQALQKLGDHALAAGDYTAAIAHYRQAVSIDAWQEAAQRGWMESLAKSGDRNAAMHVYREFLNVLRSDPTAVPDHLTSALYTRLRTEARQSTIATDTIAVKANPTPVVSGYLPQPLTGLVGREDERIEVIAVLRRSRLVTLTGPGGIGKTRLASDIAQEIVLEYPDGVWLVALETLSDGRLVARQIASVLGVTEEVNRPLLECVIAHLRDRRLLLVVDNCEHLLEATAHIIGSILRGCASIRILATSRQAMGITGEVTWTVPPLTFPEPQHLPLARATLLRVLMGYESVRLFVERAQAVQKAFALTGTNAQTIARICAQLEGIPLAVELAASRIQAMSVEQLALRLQTHLSLLSGGSRIAASRQKTLYATVDWSHELLSAPERILFRRLAVFSGGWNLEEVEAICAGEGIEPYDALDLLASLVSKSLVLFGDREREGEGRYRFLEIVRQYAFEQLQASEEISRIQSLHSDWFLALAEEAAPLLRGAEREVHLRRLEEDHANLRAVLAAEERGILGVERALRMAGALGRFWNMRGDYHEGRTALERLLEREEAQARTSWRAKALFWAGALANNQSDYLLARRLFEESLDIQRELGDRQGIADLLNTLGNAAYLQGDFAQAQELYTESLRLRREIGDRTAIADSLNNLAKAVRQRDNSALARTYFAESLEVRKELGDRRGIAEANNNLGFMASQEGDHLLARALLEESAHIFEDLGDRQGRAWALDGLGSVALRQADYPSARVYYQEALTLFQAMGVRRGIAWSLHGIGHLTCQQGDYAAARTLCTEALTLFREIGDKHGVVATLDGLANILFEQQRIRKAVHLWAVSEKMGESLGLNTNSDAHEGSDQRRAKARSLVGEDAVAAAWEEGRLLSWEQAVDYALEKE